MAFLDGTEATEGGKAGRYRGPLRGAVLDWAGTVVDHGSFAPIAALLRLFEGSGVPVSTDEVRTGMGLHKRDHIRRILEVPDVADRWRSVRRAEPDERAVGELFDAFLPVQLEVILEYRRPIAGALEAVAALRERGMVIGTTTGYTRPMMEALLPAAAEDGYTPDACVTPSEVPAGRPAPWMCFRNAIELGVYPMAAYIKVGDTVPDVEEGRNAGMWTIGLAATGNGVGLTEEELAALDPDDRERRIAVSGTVLRSAGAHYVVHGMSDVPLVVDAIEARLSRGEAP